jgi:hypothetical protein
VPVTSGVLAIPALSVFRSAICMSAPLKVTIDIVPEFSTSSGSLAAISREVAPCFGISTLPWQVSYGFDGEDYFKWPLSKIDELKDPFHGRSSPAYSNSRIPHSHKSIVSMRTPGICWPCIDNPPEPLPFEHVMMQGKERTCWKALSGNGNRRHALA